MPRPGTTLPAPSTAHPHGAAHQRSARFFSRRRARGRLPARDLEDALGQALRNLEAGIHSAQATVAHGPLPTLSVDAGQIRQVFQNLIGNALKFHSEQPPGFISAP